MENKKSTHNDKINILFEDKDIVVIYKPAGLLSVPFDGCKTKTAQDILETLMRNKGSFSATHKPLPVHRLDRDTSGVMMFALNETVQHKIMANWQKMVSERIYIAVAENPNNSKYFLPSEGVIDDPLAQNAHHVGYVPKKIEDKAHTLEAKTHFRKIFEGNTHTIFELELDTGRKNQIRAHLASKHYPLAGDRNYRAKTNPFGRLALHARTLAFKHPVTGEEMNFEVKEPVEWRIFVENAKKERREEKRSQEKISFDKMPSRKAIRKMDFISRGKKGY